MQLLIQFGWMGRPIIQYPQDIVAIQELIWQVKPDLIIETGIAHGGSLIFSASMLAKLDMWMRLRPDNVDQGFTSQSVGIDIEFAPTTDMYQGHPMATRIQMIEGSSIAPEMSPRSEKSHGIQRVLVCLDSNHTHEHVLEELRAYAPFVSPGSYCVVFDTIIEDMPADMSRTALGDRATTQDCRPGIPQDASGIRNRQEHPAQAADHRRTGWVLKEGALRPVRRDMVG